MLTIVIPEMEMFDEIKSEFEIRPEVTIELEHSLASLSKWEGIYKKPFLGKEEKSSAEVIGYVKAMTLTPDVPAEAFGRLTQDNINAINAYIEDSHTATWFSADPSAKPNREIVTAEVIYYWMIALNIPERFETRHLNQLFTVIRVANEKQKPPSKNKKSQAQMMADRRALNEQRLAQHNTTG